MSAPAPKPDSAQLNRDAAQHVSDARQLLQSLRQRLDQHPELEEAILKLEMALDALTLHSGGML